MLLFLNEQAAALQMQMTEQAAEEGAPGFFEGKSDRERARIFDAMKLSCVEAGQVLWEQDDISNGKYYFIIGGRVDVGRCRGLRNRFT